MLWARFLNGLHSGYREQPVDTFRRAEAVFSVRAANNSLGSEGHVGRRIVVACLDFVDEVVTQRKQGKFHAR